MPEQDAEPKAAPDKPSRRLKRSYGLILLGLALGMAAVLWHTYGAAPQPRPDDPGAGQEPSSEPLDKRRVDAHRVPANDPRYIAIPSIGVGKSPVIKLGLRKDGTMATPGNIHEAGWFGDSARPGRSGATFIYGHVSSWKSAGIFADLHKLRPGDTIIVTVGDGAVYRYKVVRSQAYAYDKVPMDTVLEPVTAGRPGLNLMTCAGRLIGGSGAFSERLVVYAEPEAS